MAKHTQHRSGFRLFDPYQQKMLSVLSKDVAMEIILTLQDGEQGVKELTDRLELHMAFVSRNLSALRQFGIVDYRREGRRHIYHLRPGTVVDTGGDMISVSIDTPDGGRVHLVRAKKNL